MRDVRITVADDTTQQRSQSDSRRSRDHLANERTFLAWVRTGVSVMALGMALAKFGPVVDPGGLSIPAGLVLVIGGAILLGYGLTRYRRVNTEISNDRYSTGKEGSEITTVAGVLIASVVVAMILLLF